MTIQSWLKISTSKLADSSTPQLDAEVILAHFLKRDRSWIHTNLNYTIPRSVLGKLDDAITRRTRHEPVAYIIGRQEFYGRVFKVSPDTLTPRPETETMVSMALDALKTDPELSVADIGTGSGCIAITLALEIPGLRVSGFDISKPALNIAKENATTLSAKVDFHHDDLTKNTEHQWQKNSCIVANLPYVPNDFQINLAASHEPEFAIYGGDDGLDYYRKLFGQLQTNTKLIFTESMPPQHDKLADIANTAGFKFVKSEDFIQQFKRI